MVSHGNLVANAYAIMVDGRRELAQSRGLTRLIRTTGVDVPLILITTEGGLAAVTADWGIDDVLLDNAGPAEVEARLRLTAGRLDATAQDDGSLSAPIERGELVAETRCVAARDSGERGWRDLDLQMFGQLRGLDLDSGQLDRTEIDQIDLLRLALADD